ncbi:hypothetical protein CYMTET_31524 [Cymbomonas tetramitiformis]|uniref:Uncharacterized protein n=1 Tax=Cymbomonas tetramitiformis TaxID=36881 RepID=A0AAE0FGV8_9CHLO|nr:hypothetical protein CYMTET_31524 [Cymbomonas tetramitiformis]
MSDPPAPPPGAVICMICKIRDGLVGECQCVPVTKGDMLVNRRRLDKMTQASILTSLDQADELNEAEKKLQVFLYKAIKKSKVAVGRPAKLAFANGALKFQKLDRQAIAVYIATRDYRQHPKKYRGDFQSDDEYEAWLNVDEVDATRVAPHPARSVVDKAARRNYKWSPLEIEIVLQKYNQLACNKYATVRWFQQHLQGSTIAARLQPSNIQWWEKTYLHAVSNSTTAVIGKKRGRKQALSEASQFYRKLVVTVGHHLAAGLPGNAHVISGLIRAMVQLESPTSLTSKFEVSLSYTYAFLHANDFVTRRGTTNRKEPSDWEYQWERQILRLAHIVKRYNIPPALVIGFDHTGFQLLPLQNTTWAARGASVVPMIGLDDMRQMTGVIVEAMGDNFEGLVVGIQLIYQGKTDRCLPDEGHRSKPLFSDFVFGYTYNHWADEDTNIDLFRDIIVVHLLQVKQRLQLLEDHRAVVMLDAWPVQKTASFRQRVQNKWPWIVLLYVFAGGTGRSQKFDVDGANVMKPKLSERARLYIEKHVCFVAAGSFVFLGGFSFGNLGSVSKSRSVLVQFSAKLKAGEKAEDIRLDLTMTTLKVQQLYWLGEVYAEFKANVPARTAGWARTQVPLAYTPEWQRCALEWHAEGKLWPGNTVEAIPAGDEQEPSPTTDDLEVQTFTDGQENEVARAGQIEPITCRDSFDSLGGADIENEKQQKKAKITAEDLEYDLEDMTPETVCVCLAEGKDEFSFAVKVGRYLSPLLHLLQVLDIDLEGNRIKWRWFYSKSTCMNTKTRVMEVAALEHGFRNGKHPVQAWCSFYNDEFVYCWELDEEDDPACIPTDFHSALLKNLSALLKAKRGGQKTSGAEPETSGAADAFASA